MNDTPGKNSDLQGEGNYDAARRHRQDAEDFVKSGNVDRAAREARPEDAAKAAELEKAEREGRSHSKGEAPGDEAQQSPDPKG